MSDTPKIQITNPLKSWWSGDNRVEPFMSKIKQALDRSGLSGQKRTDVYNRSYEAIYEAIKNHDSILQAKDREIAGLKVKAERDWLDKVACMKDAKNVCALTEEVKTLKSRIATLENKLQDQALAELARIAQDEGHGY